MITPITPRSPLRAASAVATHATRVDNTRSLDTTSDLGRLPAFPATPRAATNVELCYDASRSTICGTGLSPMFGRLGRARNRLTGVVSQASRPCQSRSDITLLAATLVLVVTILSPATLAQTQPTTQPTTAPTPTSAPTAPTSRPTTRPGPPIPHLPLPPGFVRLDIGERRFLLEPADEAMVRAAVAATTPATRPTTMPADLLANLAARRADLITAVKADLRLSETEAAKFPDEHLKSAIEGVAAYAPKNVLMVATRDKLIALGKAGWENPSLYYNRATGEVRASTGINLVEDPDDARGLILLAEDPKAEPSARQAKLADVIRYIDGQMMSSKSQSGMYAMQIATTKFIVEHALARLELKLDQAWFSNGVTGILGTKYVCLLTGLPERSIINSIINEPRNVPIRAATIDLLSPPDTASLRREAIPFFLDALRRKSVRAVDELVLRHGPEVIPLLIDAIAESKPADGPALVALIQKKTGTDLKPYLKSGALPEPTLSTRPTP